MQYPLPEKIGDPELLVGRESSFQNFGKWLRYIPKRLAKSRVIPAPKSGHALPAATMGTGLCATHIQPALERERGREFTGD